MARNGREIEECAVIVHGAQLVGYILGYNYHNKRDKTVFKWIAVAGMGLHTYGIVRHLCALLFRRTDE